MAGSSIVVLGSVNVDLVVRGPRLPTRGETVIGGVFYQAPGGKGANQAVAAARAGLEPVTLIAALGDDRHGDEMRAVFEREKLVCDHLKTIPNTATGVALILVADDGENAISVASGANLHLSPADVEAVPAGVFDAAGVFLTNLESPVEAVACGLRRGARAGLVTILNPAPATPLLTPGPSLRDSASGEGGRFAGVDVLTPNEGEAGLLTGIDTRTPTGVVQAARRLQAQGCRAVVITLGARGCVVVEDEATAIRACPVRAVDTTAAGDAFNGALAVALAEGKSLVAAAEWANRAAALAVGRPGAQPSLATREEILRSRFPPAAPRDA